MSKDKSDASLFCLSEYRVHLNDVDALKRRRLSITLLM